MNRISAFSLAAVGLLLAAAYALGAPPVSRSDEAAIRAQTARWEKAYNGGDAQAVAAEYAEDALLLPPGGKGVKGKAGILAYFTKDIADARAGGVVLVLDPATDVGVSGSTGWESGTFKVTVNGAVVDTGKFLSVSRKKNGTWTYIRDTWNSDTPPAPAPK
ncbi:SgcJ/EcaC family oxidoreductase [Geothrix sp. 21YS21S-2]|uniref:YybH family protein n=1 Tax=Geothrix sp. 21YS21S-2 TaxID=3068893 RepID=UPI0027BA1734|nr:SgcJ/EcaC family oxidoreductase [Geothrix sp. 21YS21S-2]